MTYQKYQNKINKLIFLKFLKQYQPLVLKRTENFEVQPSEIIMEKDYSENESEMDTISNSPCKAQKYPDNESEIDYVLSTPRKNRRSKKKILDNKSAVDAFLSSPRKAHSPKKILGNSSRIDTLRSPGKDIKKILDDKRAVDTFLNTPRKTQSPKMIFKEKNSDEVDICLSSCKIRTPTARKSFRATKSENKVLPRKALKLKTPTTPKIDSVEVNVSVDTPTRYSLRQRMKQELASMNTAVVDSDPEDSDENKSWEDDSGSDHSIENAATPLGTSGRRKKQAISSFAENYFTAQTKCKNITSNRTLSKINFKQTDVEELSQMFKSIPENHKKEKASLLQYQASLFKKWIHLLQENFSIMLYGIGSKQQILQKFCRDVLDNSLYVVIHGFFPSVTIKQVLCTITEDALNCETKFSNIYDHAEFIKSHFLKNKSELYVIIHCIDASTLRSEKCQSILSLLATVPRIHFLASVDHINCSLIWDQITLSQFNWIWFDCTTFEPYISETSYENNILRDQSSYLFLSSLLHVYHSLTPNGQGVFLILAKHQNNGKDSSNYLGIMFPEWYQQCREAFLVNSEITMQAQLSEFKNHKLLASRKSPDSIEHWYIPVDSTTLAQFLESC